MLADTKLNPAYCRKRSDLQHSTARALSLGNDITAYGHNVQFVEDTWQDSTVSYIRLPAVQPAQALLDRVAETYPIKRRPRISDYLHTAKSRRLFKEYYDILRFLGQSRRQILDVIYKELDIN